MGAALQTRDVVRFYGNQCVCRSINLSVPEGIVYGLLGRNAAGKSTLLKMAMGLVRPDRGEIEVLGHDAWELAPEVKARIAFTAEGHPLPRWMSVEELIRFTSSFYTRWQKETANQLLSHFRLPRASKVKSLSNGQRAACFQVRTVRQQRAAASGRLPRLRRGISSAGSQWDRSLRVKCTWKYKRRRACASSAGNSSDFPGIPGSKLALSLVYT